MRSDLVAHAFCRCAGRGFGTSTERSCQGKTGIVGWSGPNVRRATRSVSPVFSMTTRFAVPAGTMKHQLPRSPGFSARGAHGEVSAHLPHALDHDQVAADRILQLVPHARLDHQPLGREHLVVVLPAERTVNDPVVGDVLAVARVAVEERRAPVALGVAGSWIDDQSSASSETR